MSTMFSIHFLLNEGCGMPNAFLATWGGGHMTVLWAWQMQQSGPHQLELWLRGEERGKREEEREEQGRVGWVDVYVCCVLFVSKWELWNILERGEREVKGGREKETEGGRKLIGALRLLVSKLVCQVFRVCCVEKLLRLRGREWVCFWQEICRKPLI